MKKALQFLVQLTVLMALVWAVLSLAGALGELLHKLMPW